MKLQELREKRDALAVKARALLDEKPGKKWDDEADREYKSIAAEIGDVDSEINRHEEVLAIEAASATNNAQRVGLISDRRGISIDEATAFAAKETEVFNTFIRGGAGALSADQREFVANKQAEARRIYGAQSVGTDSEGGYLVPVDFGGRILEALQAYGGIRDVATVQQTADGVPIDWPTADATSEEGEILGENTETTDEDTDFGTVQIGAYKYSSKGVPVPFELLQDARVDIEAYIIKVLSTRIRRITSRHFTTGTGTGQPQGVVTSAAVGLTGAVGQTDSVTAQDLVNLKHSVDLAYREEGETAFMFHDDTLRALKNLTDGDGRPLWKPSIAGGEPDLIDGERFVVSNNMPTMAANARSILYGDFSKYMIRDVMDLMLFRMTDSFYTRRGQVGFLVLSRHDGRLIAADDQAIKAYVNAAS